MLGTIKKLEPVSASLKKTVKIVTKIIEVEGKGDHRTIELLSGYLIQKVKTKIVLLKYETPENQSQEMV